VPLERAARKKMMKEDRDVFDEADGVEELDETESSESAKDEKSDEEARKSDIVLTEALNILADLVRLTDGAEAPAPQPRPNRIPAWLRALGNGD
jgi:hypothetical protein